MITLFFSQCALQVASAPMRGPKNSSTGSACATIWPYRWWSVSLSLAGLYAAHPLLDGRWLFAVGVWQQGCDYGQWILGAGSRFTSAIGWKLDGGGDRLNGCTFDTLLNCKSIVPNTNGYGRPLKEYMAKLITYGSVLVSLMQITLYYIWDNCVTLVITWNMLLCLK